MPTVWKGNSSGLFFFGGDIHIYDYSMEANFCKENIFTK